MKLRWWLLGGYLVLLAASHAVRWRTEADPPHSRPSVTLPAAGASDPAIRLAYQEWGATDPEAPVLLLLHGSPGSSDDFRALAPILAERYRLIAPDLPGFGQSTRRVDDYSIRAHAGYAEILMDRLGLDRAHLVGFSMGGGVALELTRHAPERVSSITLLASIGLQEFELLGSYPINHAIHALQLGALVVLHEGVPHFGGLDGAMLDVAYARNFFDTDQRPLRAVLERLEPPTLILHGETDPLVPVAAAREHHRIVPHSELVLLDSDHFTLFREPRKIAGPLVDFVDRVESGSAPARDAATPERLAAASRPLDPDDLPKARGLTALVWGALLALATLVSEDLTCISAGLLVAQGRIGFWTAAIACSLGIFFGDLLLFLAGRALGRPWLRRPPVSWFLSEARIDAASDWFGRRGVAVIFLSRFTPGMRLPTYFAAGLLRTSFVRFAGYFALAVGVWTPLLVGASALFGAPAIDRIARLPIAPSIALPLLVVAFWLALSVGRGLATWRGRRLWLGRVRRWVEWEFWPVWIFYLPVLAHMVRLGIRHRSLTLFTAANPGMPEGGFLGESKSAILQRLPAAAVARFERLPGELTVEARRERVERFLAEGENSFPVVLKPDVGERGRGVRIARGWQDVDGCLASAVGDLVVQEYVDGPELGVFYVRNPAHDRGRIFSVTEKRLPSLIGDGRSTLEELILGDRRAVCQAPLLLERHRDRLEEVPAAGETFALVEIGTHCRGARFLDGRRFATDELEVAIDRMSLEFDGFFFGRYDLRAPDESALLEGRDLKVLELNGVTSEATHIYDPAFGLRDAYRTLFEQWRLAFEVGAENRRRGAEPAGVGRLAALIVRRLFKSGRTAAPDGESVSGAQAGASPAATHSGKETR